MSAVLRLAEEDLLCYKPGSLVPSCLPASRLPAHLLEISMTVFDVPMTPFTFATLQESLYATITPFVEQAPGLMKSIVTKSDSDFGRNGAMPMNTVHEETCWAAAGAGWRRCRACEYPAPAHPAHSSRISRTCCLHPSNTVQSS